MDVTFLERKLSRRSQSRLQKVFSTCWDVLPGFSLPALSPVLSYSHCFGEKGCTTWHRKLTDVQTDWPDLQCSRQFSRQAMSATLHVRSASAVTTPPTGSSRSSKSNRHLDPWIVMDVPSIRFNKFNSFSYFNLFLIKNTELFKRLTKFRPVGHFANSNMQRTRASSTQGLGVTESLCFWVEHLWDKLKAKQLKNVENAVENTTVSTFLHSKQHFDHTSAQKCCMSLDTRCATQISRKTIRHT